ncbi:MAG: peptidogalycan biosysnthesis protein, partial [Bacteroidales bacterium]|nr:peptidogalycan biosysnthesis protein [Bacteroidales bacterium]
PLDEQKAVGTIISEQILLKSKELSHSLVFIKEVPHGELEELQKLLSKDFCFYDSLPNCYIPVYNEMAPYPCRLREKERYRYRQLKKRFNEQFYWELVQDFSSEMDVFEGLYLDTLHRSPNQFEVLNRKFFEALNERFPQASFMLIARNKVDHKCEAAGLLLEDKDALIPLYIGINYSNSSRIIKLLHSNAIIKGVEEAEKRGLFHAVLGQTSYYPKVLSGALVERLFLGFCAHNPLVQFLIKTFFGKLFAPTRVLPNAYAKAYVPRIKKAYADKNYRIFN